MLTTKSTTPCAAAAQAAGPASNSTRLRRGHGHGALPAASTSAELLARSRSQISTIKSCRLRDLAMILRQIAHYGTGPQAPVAPWPTWSAQVDVALGEGDMGAMLLLAMEMRVAYTMEFASSEERAWLLDLRTALKECAIEPSLWEAVQVMPRTRHTRNAVEARLRQTRHIRSLQAVQRHIDVLRARHRSPRAGDGSSQVTPAHLAAAVSAARHPSRR